MGILTLSIPIPNKGLHICRICEIYGNQMGTYYEIKLAEQKFA